MIAFKKKAVPVFLRVDPLDVLRDLNLASVGTDQALETVKNWLDGHVVSKSGFISSDWEDDSQLVDQITCFVSDNLTQDSVSGRWFPRLHWLKSTRLEYGNMEVVEASPYDINWLQSGDIEVPPLPKRYTGYTSFIPTAQKSSYVKYIPYKSFGSVAEESSSYEMIGHSSALHKSSISPISHHNKPSETVNESSSDEVILPRSKPSETSTELPSSSDEVILPRINPSETSIELPSSSEQFTTNMNPFTEHSSCNLVGMKHHVKEVLSMLQQGDSTEEIRTIGIYGIEGVGKTTLGKHVYEEISPQFQHRFYIANFNKQGSSLLEIIADDETLSFSKMVGRKVLLVADSVDDIKQLKDFADNVSLFGPGSRFIVITQDRSLLYHYGVKHIYKVTCPGYEESIQIFSEFAFKQTNPVSGFERFSGRAVEVAGRIPLALKMLGTYLYGKEEDEWESTLRKLEESDNNYIKAEVLQYVIEDRFASRSLTILEHEENEVNRFPLYSFTL